MKKDLFTGKIGLIISLISFLIIVISFNLQVRTRDIIWISFFFVYGILNFYNYFNYKKKNELLTGIALFVFTIIGILNFNYIIRLTWPTIWIALLIVLISIRLLYFFQSKP